MKDELLDEMPLFPFIDQGLLMSSSGGESSGGNSSSGSASGSAEAMNTIFRSPSTNYSYEQVTIVYIK